MPCRKCRHRKRKHIEEIKCLPPPVQCSKPINPFTYQNGFVQYSSEVNPTSVTVLGSTTPVEYAGVTGYRPTHLAFDPANGTLTSGTDVNNGWVKVGNNSLITGFGNQAELDSSFVSGTNNKILRQTPPGPVCENPASIAIVGGSDNTIASSSNCLANSAIVASNNVNLLDCPNTVAIGLRLPSGNTRQYRGYSETLLTSKIYSINGIITGPIPFQSSKFVPPTVPVVATDDLNRTTAEDYTLQPQVWTGDVNAGGALYAAGGVYGTAVWAGSATTTGDWIPGPIFAKTAAVASVDTTAINATQSLNVNVTQDETNTIGGQRTVKAKSTVTTVDEDAVEEVGGDRIYKIKGDHHFTVEKNHLVEVDGEAQFKINGQSELACDHLIDRVTTRSDIYCPITQYHGDIASPGVTSGRSIFSSTYGISTDVTVLPTGTSTYNLAPLTQDVHVLIDGYSEFLDGYYLTFKDVTLSYAPGTSYNVYITTNNNVAIQYRDELGQLQIAPNGTYTIRTSGGSVGFRYSTGGIPTWNMTSEIIGQPRQ